MPVFQLETNVPKDKIPKNFHKELTTILSKTIGKPEYLFIVNIKPDQLMTMGGTNEPCGSASLLVIGKLGPVENIAHSKVIYDKVFQDLGIPKDRMILEFKDIKASDVSLGGTTVENGGFDVSTD